MRYLGVDYGGRRVGVAVSDEDGRIAVTLSTLDRKKEFMAAMKTLVEKYGVETLVFGLPLNSEGVEGESAAKMRREGERISRALGVGCDFFDERFTTRQARGIRISSAESKLQEDSIAATLILQAWLDARRAAERKDGGDDE